MTAVLAKVPNPAIEEATPFEANSIYELIREDILGGRLGANERLKVSALAARYGSSTNPVREALQQLRGEGFVVIAPNRGARVREIDENFVRDIFEMEVLIEPYLTSWFVSLATDGDIAELEAIQDEIEALNFSDQSRHNALDTRFHRVFYDRHYNRHAVDLWWKHREILGAISRNFRFSLHRKAAILSEHRELIAALKAHDAILCGEIIARHVRGSGLHIVEQMRAQRPR
ncbi:DNA-binding transcriptional regulator, GntR family [Devosia enhydra]|uniref:DNA-binding transcriptional regulator, GntR family n=1 Tax=Devosia enhydra TaxID=665118 RepID=A0A1K2I2I5_9HYPH|nr:GntR family transcriptional regulator [Devosia enhydra]SFZ86598.1 DNA-binding transcriptional regulator, GntR family [Devosia enhydra]